MRCWFCSVVYPNALWFLAFWMKYFFVHLEKTNVFGGGHLFQEPILNIHDLTQIHSDMNLPVPDPILLTNSHDGLDGVSVLYFSLCFETVGVLCSLFPGQLKHIERRQWDFYLKMRILKTLWLQSTSFRSWFSSVAWGECVNATLLEWVWNWTDSYRFPQVIWSVPMTLGRTFLLM